MMTDDVFESRLRARVVRYADGGIRPIDAYAVAVVTLEAAGSAGLGSRLTAWRRDRLPGTPRLALFAILTLLAIAVAVTVVVVGQQSKQHQELADQSEPTAPALPSTSPAMSTPVEGPSVARIAYVQGGDVYVAADDGSSATKVLDDPGVDFSNVRWLSDGRHVEVDGAGVATVVDLTTGEDHRLDLPRDAVLAWRPGTDVVATVLGPTLTQDPAELVFLDTLADIRISFGVDRGLYGLAWSADGSRLGGQRASPDEQTGSDFVSIDPDTGLATVVATVDRDIDQVAWSPELDRIAFVVASDTGCDGTVDKTCPGAADVDVVDLTAGASSKPTKIAGPLPQTQGDGNNHDTLLGPPPTPSFSPDGDWVAYRTVTGLSVVHADGTADRKLPIGHVADFTWDADSAGMTAIVTDAIDGVAGDEVHVDLATGATQASGLAGISQITPTTDGPMVDQTWQIGPEPSAIAPAPSATPSAAPTAPPTAHRLLVTTGPSCGSRATEIDLDTGAEQAIGACSRSPIQVAADGRHLIDGHDAIDLLAGTTTPVSGIHVPSPGGQWMITPPVLGTYDRQSTTDTTWEVARWDGTVVARLPRPWWNPSYGPYFPQWSDDEMVVSIATETGSIRVDLSTGERTVVPRVTGRPSPALGRQRVAYARDGDAWLADGTGAAPLNVSRFPFGGAEDAWLLPDGQTVAVLQGQRMWMIGLDGDRRSFAVESIQAPYDTRSIDWSPDHSWFAVSLSNENDDRVLRHTWFYAIDGTLLGEADGADIVWSPDSRHAAVSVNPWDLKPNHTTAPKPAPPGRLAIVHAAGGITKVAKSWEPVWSPDSSRLIVSTSAKSGAPTYLDVIDPDGSDRHRVTDYGGVTWVPDR